MAVEAGLLARFGERVERSGCTLVRCPRPIFERVEWLDAAPEAAAGIAVAPTLLAAFPTVGQELLQRGASQTGEPTTLLRCAMGVSACAAGVAETGSLLMVGTEPADRLVWLLPPKCVLVVGAGDIVPSLDEALEWLRGHPEAGAATLVTGPSKTSDVERVLTIGVQGPREVTVLLVEER